ncbi:hypothetical protein POM88_003178 [Heracleum sosnowskyi]|uniref:MBD domain-containing protein n=1 Tax=Heracleum sosnowskyi TaxID=360622 RepID=A0AAD8JI45_9APIA|nr:hypothetical protein POM88_003178 [Heracleum sosnowskyi]
MASNTEIQHDDSAAAANPNHNALVPFEPNFSDSEAPISATPVSFVMPEHAAANSASSSSNKRRKRREISELMQQQMAIELETEHQKRPKLRTMLAELFRFNFVLPKDYVPVMDDETTKLVSLGHENWLPLAERLTGWTKEVRVRTSGIHDTFYYHGDKKYRTFKDVKRYIYLGYPPCLENADEPLERLALNQPDPRQEKSP